MNWQERIKAQIDWLTKNLYETKPDIRESMQALLAVAVAAEYLSAEWLNDWHSGRMSIDTEGAAKGVQAALDKLREVGDE